MDEINISRQKRKLLMKNARQEILMSNQTFHIFNGEFDPGSGRTLAACLTHASRAGLSEKFTFY